MLGLFAAICTFGGALEHADSHFLCFYGTVLALITIVAVIGENIMSDVDTCCADICKAYTRLFFKGDGCLGLSAAKIGIHLGLIGGAAALGWMGVVSLGTLSTAKMIGLGAVASHVVVAVAEGCCYCYHGPGHGDDGGSMPIKVYLMVNLRLVTLRSSPIQTSDMRYTGK